MTIRHYSLIIINNCIFKDIDTFDCYKKELIISLIHIIGTYLTNERSIQYTFE